MTDTLDMDRRQFVVSTAVVGGGMALGLAPPRNALAAAINAAPWTVNAPAGAAELNQWILIGADDTIVIRVAQSEMGQGTMTSWSLMICEELECDWAKVRPEYASVNRHFRENKAYDRMSTSSSSSVRVSREGLQRAGASARERLKTAAAQQWNVPVAEIDAKDSVLTHRPSGRKLRYGEVAAKAAVVKLEKEPAIKTGNFTRYNKPTPLLETALRVNGSAIYSIDVQVPGMVHAAIKQSPVFQGKVKSFDFNAIKDRPGVIAAVDFGGDRTIEAGVAVVAETFWQAKTALDILPIQWDEGANGQASSEQFFKMAHAALAEPGREITKKGDALAAMKSAARVIEAIYEAPYIDHATMEPYSVTAQIAADRADVWAGSQGPEEAAQAIAGLTKLPLDKVHVHLTFLGGGFGRRLANDDVRQAVEIAQKVKRTVKVTWTREEVMRHGRYRPMRVAKFQAGFGADGNPIAYHNRIIGIGQTIPAATNDQDVRGLHELPYNIPNILVDLHQKTTHVPSGSFVSVGRSQNDFFLESFIDEMAHAVGKDPYRYRVDLIAANPAFKQGKRWIQTLNALAEKVGWGKPLPRGMGRGIAIADSRRPTREEVGIVAVAATVSVTNDGALKVEQLDVGFDVGAALVNPNVVDQQLHMQMVTATQVALSQELTIRNGRVVEGNFDDYPMMRIVDMPRVNVHFVKTTDEWIVGVGEEAIGMTAPAIANAVFAATGKRMRSMPFKHHDLSWT